ncbi:pyruvoyl-dependent arginine decarboxylase (plasmid) [Legionella sp. D16C41]|uniref:pyruvoyl-dependent arginine decarboxylase n=1 Tax=Legionella sp. D16C41 TaxID=3402688 RepID=UPI003AF8B89D
MFIVITTAVGTGPTEIAAFDHALSLAGVNNYNLLCLSSVIPIKSKIIKQEGIITERLGSWGDRLYVVMAKEITNSVNEEVYAGIGWMQAEDGRGLFVEHHGNSEASVKLDINDSLTALRKHRSHIIFNEDQFVLQGARCNGSYTCALAIAIYQVSDWDNNSFYYK